MKRHRRLAAGPYHVQVYNDLAEGDYTTHARLKSKRKAIAMADTIAKSGELARVRWIDPTDGESIPVHVADPSTYGMLYRHR